MRSLFINSYAPLSFLVLLFFVSCKKTSSTSNNNTTVVPTPVPEIRDYKKPSYELSNYLTWIDNKLIFDAPNVLATTDPTDITSSAQLDIDLDGDEDIFSFRNYDINNPSNVPPPVTYLYNGNAYLKAPASSISNIRGHKLLVGDFNNDKYPDIFCVEAFDPPPSCNCMPIMTTNKLIFNQNSSLNTVKEFTEFQGFFNAGCSGDIDQDGDLDIMLFNFHNLYNNTKNKVLINDGKGNFTITENPILKDIPLAESSELIDMNNDGFLDLILNSRLQSGTGNILKIYWGGTNNFSQSTQIDLPNIYIFDIDAFDVNKDGQKELILFSIDPSGWQVDFFETSNQGQSYKNQTAKYISNNTHLTSTGGWKHVKHIMVSDIDKNGKIDIVSTNRNVNVRWEQDNSGKFIRQ
jgi:hypothetical protein